MKKSTFFCLSAALIIVTFAGCHKDAPANTSGNSSSSPLTQYFGGGPTIPSGAAGALYAVNNIVNNSGTIDTIGSGFAWFSSYTKTLDAGAVVCNGDSLAYQLNLGGFNVAYPWYLLFPGVGSGAFITFSSNAVQWNIGGNPSTGVAGFNYTDNTPFPGVTGVNLPATISTTASLTVNFTVVGNYQLIVCSLVGGTSNAKVTQNITSGSSVTFTAAQISQIAYPGGDQVALQIMPIAYNSSNIGGKTYYFVKQNAYDFYTTTN